MSDSTNKQRPEKRSGYAANQAARKPTARKSVKTDASSKAAGPSAGSRVGKKDAAPAKTGLTGSIPKSAPAARQAKPVSPKPHKTTKASRASKVPRTTTASRVAKSGGRPSSMGHRYVATSSWSSSSVKAGAQSATVQGSRGSVSQSGAGASAGNPDTGSFARTMPASSDFSGRRTSVPKTRTPGTTNEFVAFTKSHLKIMVPIFAVIALLLLYTVVDIAASFGRIHPGVSMQGVDVGGLTVQEASQKLDEELSPILSSAHVTVYESKEVADADGAQITVSDVEQAHADETAGTDLTGDGVINKWDITAETIGAYIDGNQLAEEAYLVGRKGNFVAERFLSWFGGTKLNASVCVGAERFNALTAEINSEIGSPIVDSGIKIEDGIVSATTGKDGMSVDDPLFLKRFSAGALTSERSSFIIPMKIDPMRIKPATAQKVAEDVRKAIAEDVTIVHDPDTWVLDSADLGDLISTQVLAPGEVLSIGGGTQKVIADGSVEPAFDTSAWVDSETGYVLQAYVNQEKFDRYLVNILGALATGGAQDAYFDTSSGEVVIVESVTGFGPDRNAAEIALQTLLFGEPEPSVASDRTITLVDVTIEPNLTTEGAQAMGITERLATWTIPLSGSSERINNIRLLCNLINNSLVAPGATWSFNDTTGERTAEKGFQTAPVIINGKHEDQLGGGICQIATCIFNAACFSGLGIQERVNHDFYIASYDDYGFADATVSWKSPDLKWLNDMSTYVLMTAVCTDENVVVTFWGTQDGRTVECQRGEWTQGAKYATITEVDPALSPGESKTTQSGQDGRSIDIRYLATAADGTVLHDVVFHSIYAAQNEIITVGPSAPAAPAPATEGPAQ